MVRESAPSASHSADAVAVVDAKVVTARADTAAAMPVRVRREELQELSPHLCKLDHETLYKLAATNFSTAVAVPDVVPQPLK